MNKSMNGNERIRPNKGEEEEGRGRNPHQRKRGGGARWVTRRDGPECVTRQTRDPLRIKKSIPFTPYHRDTFYLAKSPEGYNDYPFADKEAEENYHRPSLVTKINRKAINDGLSA